MNERDALLSALSSMNAGPLDMAARAKLLEMVAARPLERDAFQAFAFNWYHDNAACGWGESRLADYAREMFGPQAKALEYAKKRLGASSLRDVKRIEEGRE